MHASITGKDKYFCKKSYNSRLYSTVGLVHNCAPHFRWETLPKSQNIVPKTMSHPHKALKHFREKKFPLQRKDL